MGNDVHTELKKLVSDLGRGSVLNEPANLRRRIAERFHDTQVAEVLSGTVKVDAPKRLVEMSNVTLTRTAVVNYAKQVSQKTGMVEDVARWAIEAWADALELTISGNAPPPIKGSLQELLNRLQPGRTEPEKAIVTKKEPALPPSEVALVVVVLPLIAVIAYFIVVQINKPAPHPQYPQSVYQPSNFPSLKPPDPLKDLQNSPYLKPNQGSLEITKWPPK